MVTLQRLDVPPTLESPVTGALLGSSITLLQDLPAQAELAFTLPTPAGESPVFYLLRQAGVPFWYVPFHGIDFMSGSNNVEVAFTRTWYVLHQLGVRDVVSGAACGCVHPDLRPGDLVVMTDFIDFATQRPRSIMTALWERVPRTWAAFVPPVCPEITDLLRDCIQGFAHGQVYNSGVLGQFEGPRYETPAEIRLAKMAGVDVVAQHNASEAVYARELGIHLGAVLYVTNYAAGLSTEWVDAVTYEERSQRGKTQCTEFLLTALVRLAQGARQCTVCPGPQVQPSYVAEPGAQPVLKPVYR